PVSAKAPSGPKSKRSPCQPCTCFHKHRHCRSGRNGHCVSTASTCLPAAQWFSAPFPFFAGKRRASPMARDSSARSQQVLLVTGMLGAGKTTALHELEDLGWE